MDISGLNVPNAMVNQAPVNRDENKELLMPRGRVEDAQKLKSVDGDKRFSHQVPSLRQKQGYLRAIMDFHKSKTSILDKYLRRRKNTAEETLAGEELDQAKTELNIAVNAANNREEKQSTLGIIPVKFDQKTQDFIQQLNELNENQHDIKHKLDEITQHIQELNELNDKKTQDIIQALNELNENQHDIKHKLDENMQNVIGAVYEAIDIDIPTCFIILDRDLDKKTTKKNKVFAHVKDAFDEFKKRIFNKEIAYFYFIDELTGKVAKSEHYPIKIKSPKEFLIIMEPLMNFGLKALILFNNLAGLFNILGVPLVGIPSDILSSCEEAFDDFKKNISTEFFDLDRKQKIQRVRYAELRLLKNFIHDNDEARDFAGLFRLHDDRGLALWTKVKDEKEQKVWLQNNFNV